MCSSKAPQRFNIYWCSSLKNSKFRSFWKCLLPLPTQKANKIILSSPSPFFRRVLQCASTLSLVTASLVHNASLITTVKCVSPPPVTHPPALSDTPNPANTFNLVFVSSHLPAPTSTAPLLPLLKTPYFNHFKIKYLAWQPMFFTLSPSLPPHHLLHLLHSPHLHPPHPTHPHLPPPLPNLPLLYVTTARNLTKLTEILQNISSPNIPKLMLMKLSSPLLTQSNPFGLTSPPHSPFISPFFKSPPRRNHWIIQLWRVWWVWT